MSYSDFTATLRRRDILDFLKNCGGRLNDEVLREALDRLAYPHLARQVVREDISFLAGRGLVKEEWIGDFLIAHITKRGVEVADGRIAAEGVAQPEIGV